MALDTFSFHMGLRADPNVPLDAGAAFNPAPLPGEPCLAGTPETDNPLRDLVAHMVSYYVNVQVQGPEAIEVPETEPPEVFTTPGTKVFIRIPEVELFWVFTHQHLPDPVRFRHLDRFLDLLLGGGAFTPPATTPVYGTPLTNAVTQFGTGGIPHIRLGGTILGDEWEIPSGQSRYPAPEKFIPGVNPPDLASPEVSPGLRGGPGSIVFDPPADPAFLPPVPVIAGLSSETIPGNANSSPELIFIADPAMSTRLRVWASNMPHRSYWRVTADVAGAAPPGNLASLSWIHRSGTVFDVTPTSAPANGFYIEVIAVNAWGQSQSFVLRNVMVGTSAGQLAPLLTGFSVETPLNGNIPAPRVIALTPPPSPTNGGIIRQGYVGGGNWSTQHFRVRALVIGKVDGCTWTLPEVDGLRTIPNDLEGTPLVTVRLSLPLRADGTETLLADVRCLVAGNSLSTPLFRARLGIGSEPMLPYPSWRTPKLMELIAQRVRDVLSEYCLRELPVFPTHSRACLERRWWRGGNAFYAGQRPDNTFRADQYYAPDEWRLLRDTPESVALANDLHGFNWYSLMLPLPVPEDTGDKSPAEETIEAILNARGVTNPSERESQSTFIHESTGRNDPMRGLQGFLEFTMGRVRQAAPESSQAFLVNMDPNTGFIRGLNAREDWQRDESGNPVPEPDGKLVKIFRDPLPPLRPTLQWLPAWGWPFADVETFEVDPRFSNKNQNASESPVEPSIDPYAPPILEVEHRLLRKPAMELYASKWRSEEARFQAWCALLAGSQGAGWFAQFYVADEVIRDVYEPIAWEIRFYADLLSWNRINVSAGVSFTASPPAPIIPPNHPVWLPPVRLILRRSQTTHYRNEVDAAVELPGGSAQTCIILFNRSSSETALQLGFGSLFSTSLLPTQWRQYRYREPVDGLAPVSAEGTQSFTLPPYSIQIWHLEPV